MNIYARIRKIEDFNEFKRLVDTVLGSEFGQEYQSIKEWCDFGIDGYNKKQKIVYAFYCPKYPERRKLQQYRDKVISDINKLHEAIEAKNITLPVEEWIFVTPDDLTTEIIEFINQKAKEKSWRSGTLTAQVLAPLFMKYENIHFDFPSITAGLQLDKVPSVDIRLAENRSYKMIEIFNDGTEDIKNMEVQISEDGQNWRGMTDYFLYEFNDPTQGEGHSLYNLRKGERQYCNCIPIRGGFHFKISGIGVESNKTIVKEGFIDKIQG